MHCPFVPFVATWRGMVERPSALLAVPPSLPCSKSFTSPWMSLTGSEAFLALPIHLRRGRVPALHPLFPPVPYYNQCTKQIHLTPTSASSKLGGCEESQAQGYASQQNSKLERIPPLVPGCRTPSQGLRGLYALDTGLSSKRPQAGDARAVAQDACLLRIFRKGSASWLQGQKTILPLLRKWY